jgi:hypothetical protein
MEMKHPDSKESIQVHPAQVQNMKNRGFVEVKPVKEVKK